MIVVSVLLLSIGGYFVYPTLANMVLPQRHVVNAFINFGGRLQNMVDSLSDKLEFMEIDGELEVYLDAFPVLKEVMTVQDDSDNINIRFWLESNKIHISASQLLRMIFQWKLIFSDINKLKESNISSQLPTEYEQYQDMCKN